jgi:hypothetical protein
LGPETFRRLQSQGGFFLYGAAYKIGEGAVGKGDVLSPFQKYNFRRFIQPAQPSRRGGPSGYPAHNNNFFRHTGLPVCSFVFLSVPYDSGYVL